MVNVMMKFSVILNIERKWGLTGSKWEAEKVCWWSQNGIRSAYNPLSYITLTVVYGS